MSQALAIQSTPATFALPSAEVIRSKATGKVLGSRQSFALKSAKEIKDALKLADPSLKGAKLQTAVNSVLSGEKQLREQLGVAWLQASFQAGWTPDLGDLRKKTGTLKLVKVDNEKEAALAALKKMDKVELLKALGWSEEDIALLAATNATSH